MPFDYKCICVIGATSGIGKALAEALVNIPSAPVVVAVGRREERLKALEQESNGRIKAFVADVGDSSKAAVFVQRLLKEYPRTDAVIVNAGIQRLQDWFDPENGVDLDSLDREWEQNYPTVMHLSKYLLAHFKTMNKGALIAVSSSLAAIPRAEVANYCASKAAVHSLLLSLRFAYRDSPISIREISPPLVESELHDESGRTELVSKYWVPLSVYIPEVIKQLVETDNEEITYGFSALGYDKFESGKFSMMLEISKQERAMILE